MARATTSLLQKVARAMITVLLLAVTVGMVALNLFANHRLGDSTASLNAETERLKALTARLNAQTDRLNASIGHGSATGGAMHFTQQTDGIAESVARRIQTASHL